PTAIHPLSLHDALPISPRSRACWAAGWPTCTRCASTSTRCGAAALEPGTGCRPQSAGPAPTRARLAFHLPPGAEPLSTHLAVRRSEEHTSELQSRSDLV